jgi:hypothetical protein
MVVLSGALFRETGTEKLKAFAPSPLVSLSRREGCDAMRGEQTYGHDLHSRADMCCLHLLCL